MILATGDAVLMPSDFAIHSDLLVYWTGAKDIEVTCGTAEWHNRGRPKHGKDLTDAYINWLKDILEQGLWMTLQEPPRIRDFAFEAVACTCFTELKLSESRTHATQYGRLGVAFKRPFLFRRGGRPVVYYGSTSGWMENDRFLQGCAQDLKDKRLIHFFKPMNSSDKLTYDLYSESEWRLIFDDQKLKDGCIVDPRDDTNIQAHSYFQSLSPPAQDKLRYLVPVDGWLAMIIYPSLHVKNAAQAASSPIPGLLKALKAKPNDHANKVEEGNYPVEMDLDLCKHL